MLQKYAITACTLFLLATCNSIGAEEANQFDHSLEELSRQFELDLLRVFESSQKPAESVEKQVTITHGKSACEAKILLN
jgi:hypothetical protein